MAGKTSSASDSIVPEHTHKTDWLPIIIVAGVIVLCCGGSVGGGYSDYARSQQDLDELKNQLGEERNCRILAASSRRTSMETLCDTRNLEADCALTLEEQSKIDTTYVQDISLCDEQLEEINY